MKFFKNAFTLAEVLITLGIIGIIAAITMPALVAEHRTKETVAKLKKFYSTIQQAQLMTIKNEGYAADWGIANSLSSGENSQIYYNNFKKYLNIQKDCGISTNCLPPRLIYKYRNGTASGDFGTTYNFAKAVLADGSIFWIDINHGDCDYNDGTTKNICGYIMFDINGYKKPNKMGDDLFYFIVLQDKIIPEGSGDYTPDSSDSFESGCYRYGGSCTAWVIYNENMDYKHCTDLSWNGKTKCSN